MLSCMCLLSFQLRASEKNVEEGVHGCCIAQRMVRHTGEKSYGTPSYNATASSKWTLTKMGGIGVGWV